MPNTIKARFVGGPLHNSVIQIPDCAFYKVAAVDTGSSFDGGFRPPSPWMGQHVYCRRRFVTYETCTPFIEYWHESVAPPMKLRPHVIPTWEPLAEHCDVVNA